MDQETTRAVEDATDGEETIEVEETGKQYQVEVAEHLVVSSQAQLPRAMLDRYLAHHDFKPMPQNFGLASQ